MYLKFDSPEPWQLTFQDSASSVGEGIFELHNDIMFYVIIILSLVTWMLVTIIYTFANNKVVSKYIVHGALLEIIWTISPAFVLISIAFPSFRLLYLMDEIIDPELTIKVIGHQWYWSYEYSDYFINNQYLAFDSYLVNDEDLKEGDLRLLEVDNNLVVPSYSHVRIIVTAADVIHSWAVPSLGIKMDCVPGRLNQTSFFAKRHGIYYGQCSEICGVNHGFMPIVVQAVPLNQFISFIQSFDE